MRCPAVEARYSPVDADHGISWRMKMVVKHRNSKIATADSTQHVLSSGVNLDALEKWSLRKSTPSQSSRRVGRMREIPHGDS